MDPITFQLTLKRNLSISWFNDLPDLEVLARLETIHLLLTHEDYCFAMRALNDNFSEGVPKLTQKTSEVSQGSAFRAAIESVESRTTRESDEQEAQTSPAHTTVKFAFTMDSLIFDLATGGDKTVRIILFFKMKIGRIVFLS